MNIRAVDFLRPPSSPPLGWWFLGAGVVTLGLALWCDGHWAAERAELEQLGRLRAEAQRARQQPPPPAIPSVTERRWQQAQAELRRPLMPALRAVESAPADPIYLLSLSVEPSSGLLKLDAEAPDFERTLAYARTLDQGGALQRTALVSHEQIVDPGSGRNVVRFSLTTHWSAR